MRSNYTTEEVCSTTAGYSMSRSTHQDPTLSPAGSDHMSSKLSNTTVNVSSCFTNHVVPDITRYPSTVMTSTISEKPKIVSLLKSPPIQDQIITSNSASDSDSEFQKVFSEFLSPKKDPNGHDNVDGCEQIYIEISEGAPSSGLHNQVDSLNDVFDIIIQPSGNDMAFGMDTVQGEVTVVDSHPDPSITDQHLQLEHGSSQEYRMSDIQMTTNPPPECTSHTEQAKEQVYQSIDQEVLSKNPTISHLLNNKPICDIVSSFEIGSNVGMESKEPALSQRSQTELHRDHSQQLDGGASSSNKCHKQKQTVTENECLSLKTFQNGLNLTDFETCVCHNTEGREEVSEDQVFVASGNMYRLDGTIVLKIGNIKMHSFVRENSLYVPKCLLFRLLDCRSAQFLRQAFKNSAGVRYLHMMGNDIDLISQKYHINSANVSKELVDVVSLRKLVQKQSLHMRDSDLPPGLSSIAYSAFMLKMKSAKLRCTSCGNRVFNSMVKDEYATIDLQTFDDKPIELVPNYNALVNFDVGFIDVPNTKLPAFMMKNRKYVSIKDLVDLGVFSLTYLQEELSKLQYKPLCAPRRVVLEFKVLYNIRSNSLWLDTDTLVTLCESYTCERPHELCEYFLKNLFHFELQSNVMAKDPSYADKQFTVHEKSVLVVDTYKRRSKFLADGSTESFFIKKATKRTHQASTNVKHTRLEVGCEYVVKDIEAFKASVREGHVYYESSDNPEAHRKVEISKCFKQNTDNGETTNSQGTKLLEEENEAAAVLVSQCLDETRKHTGTQQVSQSVNETEATGNIAKENVAESNDKTQTDHRENTTFISNTQSTLHGETKSSAKENDLMVNNNSVSKIPGHINQELPISNSTEHLQNKYGETCKRPGPSNFDVEMIVSSVPSVEVSACERNDEIEDRAIESTFVNNDSFTRQVDSNIHNRNSLLSPDSSNSTEEAPIVSDSKTCSKDKSRITPKFCLVETTKTYSKDNPNSKDQAPTQSPLGSPKSDNPSVNCTDSRKLSPMKLPVRSPKLIDQSVQCSHGSDELLGEIISSPDFVSKSPPFSCLSSRAKINSKIANKIHSKLETMISPDKNTEPECSNLNILASTAIVAAEESLQTDVDSFEDRSDDVGSPECKTKLNENVKKEFENKIKQFVEFRVNKGAIEMSRFLEGSQAAFPALFHPYPDHPDAVERQRQFAVKVCRWATQQVREVEQKDQLETLLKTPPKKLGSDMKSTGNGKTADNKSVMTEPKVVPKKPKNSSRKSWNRKPRARQNVTLNVSNDSVEKVMNEDSKQNESDKTVSRQTKGKHKGSNDSKKKTKLQPDSRNKEIVFDTEHKVVQERAEQQNTKKRKLTKDENSPEKLIKRRKLNVLTDSNQDTNNEDKEITDETKECVADRVLVRTDKAEKADQVLVRTDIAEKADQVLMRTDKAEKADQVLMRTDIAEKADQVLVRTDKAEKKPKIYKITSSNKLHSGSKSLGEQKLSNKKQNRVTKIQRPSELKVKKTRQTKNVQSKDFKNVNVISACDAREQENFSANILDFEIAVENKYLQSEKTQCESVDTVGVTEDHTSQNQHSTMKENKARGKYTRSIEKNDQSQIVNENDTNKNSHAISKRKLCQMNIDSEKSDEPHTIAKNDPKGYDNDSVSVRTTKTTEKSLARGKRKSIQGDNKVENSVRSPSMATNDLTEQNIDDRGESVDNMPPATQNMDRKTMKLLKWKALHVPTFVVVRRIPVIEMSIQQRMSGTDS